MLTFDNMVLRQGSFSVSAHFSIAEGSRTAVIGPSGAGKSTLLSAVAGFLSPEHGRILWNDADLSGQDPGERPVSVLFQDNNLFPHLTVAQNVGLGLRPSLRLSGAEQDQITHALHRVGLSDLKSRTPSALSGGQQSRVALARVLLQNKPILLMDEPFAALGPGLKTDMLDLVLDLTASNGNTLIMVTHDPKDAHHLKGDTVFVADNVAHAPQNTARLFAQPPEALRDYLT